MIRSYAVLFAVLGFAGEARAQDDRRAGLFTEARQLPLVAQSVILKVGAGEARLDVVQSFRNDGDRVAQADFRMPLPEGASIEGFGYWRGETYLASTLKAKEEAEARHEAAVSEGRSSGIARTTGSFASFSVVPVEAGALQRVRVRLRLPIVTELGRSHVVLPIHELLAERPVPTAADVRIEAEAPIETWQVEGAAPVPIHQDGARLRFAASFEASGHVWWREARDVLEASVASVALPEGDHGFVLRAFMSSEAFDDQVRPTVAVLDVSFSMRRRLEAVEAALRRLGSATKIVLVAETAQVASSIDEALAALDDGRHGHALEPFALYRTLDREACLRGARCVVLTDAPAAAAHLAGVEVAALALADADELEHVEARLPGGVVVHRRADGMARIGQRIDALVRPSLRLVSARGVSGAPVELLEERRSAPAGSVLRLPARGSAHEALLLQLEVGGQALPLRVHPHPVKGDEAKATQRAVYRAELARMMRRYRGLSDGDEQARLRAEMTALSLREDIPTAFTARQVDDPELSLAAIKGGDPHLTLSDRPERAGAVAIYPFGEIRELVRDPSRGEWVDRFLAPRHWSEHAYRVDVQEAFTDGTSDRRHVWYLLDDARPEVELGIEEGFMVVRTEDAAGVSSVRALAGARSLALSSGARGWRVRLGELPPRFELRIRDRAGNLSSFNVLRRDGRIEVEAPPKLSSVVELPDAPIEVEAEGLGRFPARFAAGRFEVQTPTGRLIVPQPPSNLASPLVEAHLDLGEGRHLLGFADGSLLALTCKTVCEARAVAGTRRAHPVRGLAALRGRVYAAVLGVGLMEMIDGSLQPSGVRLSTRFVTDVVAFGGRIYLSTLYDGLWRIVGRRAIKTRFSGAHVDRLDASGPRLELTTAQGRFLRVGTDRFVRSADVRFPVGQDDLTSIVRHGGRIWVGSFDDGLLFLDPEGDLRRAPFRFPGGARAQHINALASLGDALFVGTEAGLFSVLDGRVEDFSTAAVHDLSVGAWGGREARLLAATSAGLVAVDGEGEVERLDTANAGVRAFSAVAVFDGRVWAGSIDGLWKLGSRGLLPVSGGEGFRGGWVTALHEHEGQLHVGTYAQGVWRRGPGGVFAALPGLEDMWVPFHALRSLPGGRLWVGGLGQAPRVYQAGEVEAWPIPARDANAVHALSDGRFAVATSEGWMVIRLGPGALARR